MGNHGAEPLQGRCAVKHQQRYLLAVFDGVYAVKQRLQGRVSGIDRGFGYTRFTHHQAFRWEKGAVKMN